VAHGAADDWPSTAMTAALCRLPSDRFARAGGSAGA